MRIIRYPARETWEELTRRPQMSMSDLTSVVCGVLEDVRKNGDEAVKRYEEKFDHVALSSIKVSDKEMDEAEHLVSDELKESLRQAHYNIHTFHEKQRFSGEKVETQPGVTCPSSAWACMYLVVQPRCSVRC